MNVFENCNNPNNSFNNNDLINRLCLCTENTNIYVSPVENGKGSLCFLIIYYFCVSVLETVYCTAVDSISEKSVGCNNVVNINKHCLLRPSYRVPYIILCDLHYHRLLRHNCCPTCGLFCTQVSQMIYS